MLQVQSEKNCRCVGPSAHHGPLHTHSASTTALASAALGVIQLSQRLPLIAVYEPNPGLQDHAVWSRGWNSPFSAWVSCEFGCASPWPVYIGVTLTLLRSFDDLEEWVYVSSQPREYSIGPECVSASPSKTVSHWGDCVSESVFGQSKDLNLALWHLTLSSWILLGESAEQTPMLSCFSSASLVLHFVSMMWWKIKGVLFWAQRIISYEIQEVYFLVLCLSSKLKKKSCFQAALQPLCRGVCSHTAIQLERQEGMNVFPVWVACGMPWPARNMDTVDFCHPGFSILQKLISESRATSVWCQMLLADMNGEPDWKRNVSQWFQTDDFLLHPLMLSVTSMPVYSEKVTRTAWEGFLVVANPVFCAELPKRATRWASRRLSAFSGVLPEDDPAPFPPSRGRAAAARRRRSAAEAGPGPGPRPGPALPFPSRPTGPQQQPAPQRGASPARRAPRPVGWCPAPGGGTGETVGGLAGWLSSRRMRRQAAAGRQRGEAERSGRSRGSLPAAAPELVGCHHCSAGWPR